MSKTGFVRWVLKQFKDILESWKVALTLEISIFGVIGVILSVAASPFIGSWAILSGVICGIIALYGIYLADGGREDWINR